MNLLRQMRVAIPSTGKGGLNGKRAAHFGKCDVFTIIDCENGEVLDVHVIQNQDHVQGSCIIPVNLLVENNVNALLVGGIGTRPLMGFRQVGIRVYNAKEHDDIQLLVENLLAGNILELEGNRACGSTAAHTGRYRERKDNFRESCHCNE